MMEWPIELWMIIHIDIYKYKGVEGQYGATFYMW